MITMTAKIDIFKGNNGSFESVSCNLPKAEFSADVGAILGQKKNAQDIATTNHIKNVDYFVGDVLSTDGKWFEEDYVFEIKTDGSPIHNLCFQFDNLHGQHPPQIKLQYGAEKKIENLISSSNYSLNNGVYSTGGIIYVGNRAVNSSLKIVCFPNYHIVTQYVGWIDDNNIEWRITATEPTTMTVTIYYEKEENLGEFPVYFYLFVAKNIPSSRFYRAIISDWNTANAPLVLTGIFSGVSIDVNARNLVSVGSKTTDRGDLKLPSFGIISNTGSLELNDALGEILCFAENGFLDKGQPCKIFLNDTLSGKTEQIADLETEQWNYENEGKSVSVALQDDLEEWQNINVAGIDYKPRTPEAKPLEWLYRYLWGITVTNYNMRSFEGLDEETKRVLQNTYIRYPLLESGTLWQQWTKFCQVGQCHIFKNRNGVIGCRYNGGN